MASLISLATARHLSAFAVISRLLRFAKKFFTRLNWFSRMVRFHMLDIFFVVRHANKQVEKLLTVGKNRLKKLTHSVLPHFLVHAEYKAPLLMKHSRFSIP